MTDSTALVTVSGSTLAAAKEACSIWTLVAIAPAAAGDWVVIASLYDEDASAIEYRVARFDGGSLSGYQHTFSLGEAVRISAFEAGRS